MIIGFSLFDKLATQKRKNYVKVFLRTIGASIRQVSTLTFIEIVVATYHCSRSRASIRTVRESHRTPSFGDDDEEVRTTTPYYLLPLSLND